VASALAVYSGVSKSPAARDFARPDCKSVWLHRLNDATQDSWRSVIYLRNESENARRERADPVHMIDARRVKRRRAALDAVHHVALAQQEFRQIAPSFP